MRRPPPNLYVEHVVAGQWAPDERDDLILATALADRKRYGPAQAPLIYIEQEPGFAGIDSFRHITRKPLPITETKLYERLPKAFTCLTSAEALKRKASLPGA
jgi:hypothetical protein